MLRYGLPTGQGRWVSYTPRSAATPTKPTALPPPQELPCPPGTSYNRPFEEYTCLSNYADASVHLVGVRQGLHVRVEVIEQRTPSVNFDDGYAFGVVTAYCKGFPDNWCPDGVNGTLP